jgi:hypothetical protein
MPLPVGDDLAVSSCEVLDDGLDLPPDSISPCTSRNGAPEPRSVKLARSEEGQAMQSIS